MIVEVDRWGFDFCFWQIAFHNRPVYRAKHRGRATAKFVTNPFRLIDADEARLMPARVKCWTCAAGRQPVTVEDFFVAGGNRRAILLEAGETGAGRSFGRFGASPGPGPFGGPVRLLCYFPCYWRKKIPGLWGTLWKPSKCSSALILRAFGILLVQPHETSKKGLKADF